MAFALSQRDQTTLNLILNGGEATTADPYIVDPQLAPDQHLNTKIVVCLVQQEKEAIVLFDKGQLDSAERILDSIVSKYPKYASGYNNRAQIYREINKIDPRAIKDLHRAVELATPSTRFLSKMQATVLKNAYAQLAAIELELSKKAQRDQIKWKHQEAASNYLSVAGSFGDKIMSTLATKVNPFAKLCGGMVEQALARERGELGASTS